MQRQDDYWGSNPWAPGHGSIKEGEGKVTFDIPKLPILLLIKLEVPGDRTKRLWTGSQF